MHSECITSMVICCHKCGRQRSIIDGFVDHTQGRSDWSCSPELRMQNNGSWWALSCLPVRVFCYSHAGTSYN